MKIQGKGYKNEQEFIKDAMVNPIKRKEFKAFNVPLVEEIAKLIVKQHHLDLTMTPILTEVGLKTFDKAFNSYIKQTCLKIHRIASQHIMLFG